MAQKYAISAPGINFVWRSFAGNPGQLSMVQLSDGTPVWLDQSTNQGPRLQMSPDRASVQTIAAGLPFAAYNGEYTSFSLCRDASDNLYAVGADTGDTSRVRVIPFIKGTGKTWTQGTAGIILPSNGGILFSTAVKWCNTGGGTGGAGHLVVRALNSSSNTGTASTLDAGKLLAGQGSSAFVQTLTLSTTSNGAGLVDLEPDGFGSPTLATFIDVGSGNAGACVFSVSNTGSVGVAFSGGALALQYYNTSKPQQLIRLSPNLWAVIGPWTGQQQWSVATFNAAGMVRNADIIDSGSSDMVWTVSCAATRDPSGTNRLLVYGLSVQRNADVVVRRFAIQVGATSSVAAVKASDPVIDDTLTGTGANYGANQVGQNMIRASREPAQGIVDWQVTLPNQNNGGQFYNYGNYTGFNNAPTAATPTTPATGSSVDRTTPITLAWVFNDPDAGDSQSKSDIRYKLTSASTWATILGATTTATSYALPANQTAGNYEWQVLTYDALGVASPWSSSSFFTAADPPGTPVITAPANGGTIATASYTVTWSSPQQDAYEVRRVADNAGSPSTGTVYLTTGTVEDATSRARTLTFDTNNRTEHVQVRVRYSGIWSQWASVRAVVSYTPPATPVVVLTVQDATASILVSITNPTPSGSQPTVASHDILIDDGLGGGLTRRATGWPAGTPYTYWLSRSGRDYAGNIKVVAVATNSTTSTGTAT